MTGFEPSGSGPANIRSLHPAMAGSELQVDQASLHHHARSSTGSDSTAWIPRPARPVAAVATLPTAACILQAAERPLPCPSSNVPAAPYCSRSRHARLPSNASHCAHLGPDWYAQNGKRPGSDPHLQSLRLPAESSRVPTAPESPIVAPSDANVPDDADAGLASPTSPNSTVMP